MIIRYRVALWRTWTALKCEREYPVEAHNAVEAAEMALEVHKVAGMGAIIVMSEDKQETFDNCILDGGKVTYDSYKSSPRTASMPFDWMVQSDRHVRPVVEL
jgi:hypothetical protein